MNLYSFVYFAEKSASVNVFNYVVRNLTLVMPYNRPMISVLPILIFKFQ